MPTIPEALALALQYHRAGRLQDAEALYRQVLQAQPDHPDALHLIGVVAHQDGRHDVAIAHIGKALAVEPARAEFHNNIGEAYRAQEKLDEAAAHYRRAMALRPAYPQPYNNLAIVLTAQGRYDEAVAQCRLALAHQPDYAEAYNNLGVALKEQGMLEEAIGHYRRALALKPAYVEAHNNLGLALAEQGRAEEAADCYRHALALQPNHAGFAIKLATVLPVIPGSGEEIRRARAAFEKNIDSLTEAAMTLRDPLTEVGRTNFYLAYHGCDDRDLQVKTARMYERACPSLSYTAPHCAIPRTIANTGKIKIGFISRYFKTHSIGKITRGLLAELSREKFEVCAVFIGPVEHDPMARFIHHKADRCVVVPAGLKTARERIADEQFDILFYQDIGMDPFAYFLAFSRLAPVQCVTWGHPVTTGLRSMDYFISSELFEPDDAERHYTERLVRLKCMPTYYYRPDVPASLKPRAVFGLDENAHVYLCPHTLFKFHPDCDAILAGILRADPSGRVVLVDGVHGHWRELLLRRLGAAMPDVVGRCQVVPRLSEDDFNNLIAVADVMLDTVHFCGMNTSMQGLAVGTPIVTLPGEFQRSRHTYGLYRKMGFLDCVANSPDQYVAIAVRLGTDAAYRAEVRQKILACNHVLYEDREVVREFERFFVEAVDAACRAPSSGA